MTERFRTRFIFIALLLSALALTACQPAATPEAQPAESQEQDSAPAEEQAAEEPADAQQGAFVEINIVGFGFEPGELTISAGTTVTWQHDSSSPHTVTADDGSFSSPTLGNGDSFSFTFEEPGTYAYHCEFHGATGGTGMSGVIVVSDN